MRGTWKVAPAWTIALHPEKSGDTVSYLNKADRDIDLKPWRTPYCHGIYAGAVAPSDTVLTVILVYLVDAGCTLGHR